MFERRSHQTPKGNPNPKGTRLTDAPAAIAAIHIPQTIGFTSLGGRRDKSRTTQALNSAFLTRTGTAILSGYTSRASADRATNYQNMSDR